MRKKLTDLKNIDIIVGIPSFNEQSTIGYVVKKVDEGLKKFYNNKKALIVNCDTGSTDNTKEAFLSVKTKTEKLHLATAHDVLGKGNGIKLLLQLAKRLKPKVVVINDSDLRTITPRWIKEQADPIFRGYDFGVPHYKRYEYDATITNNICYPLVYGLFCQDIRQPIGGDFSFSGKLGEKFLEAKWTKNTKYFGIDIFMTTNAILNNARICNINLGVKLHNHKDPGASLSPMFRQVVSTLFKIIIANKDKIKRSRKIKKIPVFGKKKKGVAKSFDIDTERLKSRFTDGFIEHKHIIKKCLSKEDFTKLRACVFYDAVYILPDFWTKIVYDYILSYKKYERMSSTILRSFVPLWFGRVYTFVKQTTNMGAERAEKLIIEQAKEFYKQRGYLLRKL